MSNKMEGTPVVDDIVNKTVNNLDEIMVYRTFINLDRKTLEDIRDKLNRISSEVDKYIVVREQQG